MSTTMISLVPAFHYIKDSREHDDPTEVCSEQDVHGEVVRH